LQPDNSKNSFIFKDIQKDQDLLINSEKILIKPNQYYQLNFPIILKKGLPYSIYFSVIVCDSNFKEITRYIKWINDIQEDPIDYSMSFLSPANSKFVVLGLRVNTETPVKSHIEIGFKELNSLKLEESKNFVTEKFDRTGDFVVPKFELLSQEEENELEKNLVWIFGSPRTGTTWLGTQLLKHSKTITWHEPYIGWHLDHFKKWQNERNEYFFSSQHKNNWLPYLRKLILARTFSMAQILTKKVVIKEPNGSGAANIIMECFPNSKLIFLLRDGRDVVDSQMDTHQKGSWSETTLPNKRPTIQNQEMKLEMIKKYCQEWERMTKIVWSTYQNHNQNLRYLIKYEDLKYDTMSQLQKIYDFLEISVDSLELKKIVERYNFDAIPTNQKGPGKFYRFATPGSWEEHFNQEEKQLMNSILGKSLAQFDYKV